MPNINNKTPVDFIFMSYDEEYADENYEKLLKLVPDAKRIHGVKGIANAWKAAADICESDYYITMDADTELNENFAFGACGFFEGDQRIHVWRSLNPVNGLVYGHGSIHMFSKKLVQSFTNTDVVDFTLNVGSEGFVIQEEIATTTRFNRSPQLTWRSAFREASKLASGTNIYTTTDDDWVATEPVSASRLFVWCSVGADAPYGEYSISGARAGALHGFKHRDNPDRLADIADYSFLENEYDNNTTAHDAGEKLKEYGLMVQDFTAEQSKELKKLWYNINADVTSRYNDKINDFENRYKTQ